MLMYAYFTPKVDFKRKFNHHQSFPHEWRLTARTIRKFRIGPYESNLESDVRFEIESNHEASQVLTCKVKFVTPIGCAHYVKYGCHSRYRPIRIEIS